MIKQSVSFDEGDTLLDQDDQWKWWINLYDLTYSQLKIIVLYG